MAKRIRSTGSGKLLRRHAFRNHFLSKKSSSRKRAYGKTFDLDPTYEKTVKRQLGQ
jgi:large subunit ribosomal protein L35